MRLGSCFVQISSHQYSDAIRQAKVLLIGVFPPPLGGISVHLKRVKAKLEAKECVVWAWDVRAGSHLRYYWQLTQFCLKKRPEVIIYHTLQLRSVPIELFIVLFMGRILGSKIIAVIHSARFVTRMGWLNGKITSWLLGRYNQVVLVSDQLKGQLLPKIELKRANVVVESPFLSPVLSEKQQILDQMPASLKHFLVNHGPIVTVSITRSDQWQGQDLYGTDLALWAFERLRQDFQNAGLLIVLGNQNGKTLELGPNIYLLSEWPYEMWPLIAKSNLFIRPTRSDSFGISVAEALWLEVPVVASDVCVRPSGTILFKSGDAQDLYEKMKQVLALNFQLHG